MLRRTTIITTAIIVALAFPLPLAYKPAPLPPIPQG